ncbi:hypothetical protein [Paenibacillus sp. GCM10027626]|uniref:hypothetical protein n=1 Tax=Paenibacillus sp. GCM10027626 TaxID=3273411 RepID=UPI0036341103
MWNPVDQQFYAPKLPVAIAAIGDGQEAIFIRTLLEQFNVVTLMHMIGTPGDFLQVIGQEENAPPYLIISAHGEEGGLVFGEYIEEIDVSSLQDEVMPPEVIGKAVRLLGTVIINTACSGGVQAAGETFLRGGAKAYIAADEDVSGEATTLFLVHLFHKLTKEEGCTLEEAWEHAASYDEESRLYRLYLPDAVFKIGSDGQKQKLR